jgi:predicted RNA binding protein YcfA (HicA-like mRNA interferase family)
MTAKQVIERLTREGWSDVRQSGGHKIFKHPVRMEIVVVPVHPGRDIPAGTLADIKRKAGWQR